MLKAPPKPPEPICCFMNSVNSGRFTLPSLSVSTKARASFSGLTSSASSIKPFLLASTSAKRFFAISSTLKPPPQPPPPPPPNCICIWGWPLLSGPPAVIVMPTGGPPGAPPMRMPPCACISVMRSLKKAENCSRVTCPEVMPFLVAQAANRAEASGSRPEE